MSLNNYMKKIAAICFILLSYGGIAQNVNLYTGDFSYGVNLLQVPSPDGPAIPIRLSYSAGITPSQKASWAGLGWSYSPGAITRNVNGAPDDWNGVSVINLGHKNENNTINKNRNGRNIMYGPFYYDQFSRATDNPHNLTYNVMDVFQSKLQNTDAVITLPNYDRYFVNAPGVVGEIKPFLFEHGALISRNMVNQDNVIGRYDEIERTYAKGVGSIDREFTQKPIFYLLNEMSDGNGDVTLAEDVMKQLGPLQEQRQANTITLKPVVNAVLSGSGNTEMKDEALSEIWWNDLGGTSFNSYNYNKNTGSTAHSNSSKHNRGTHIQYFTNRQILNAGSNTYATIGLINYPGYNRAAKTEQDQIGGYTVTNTQGYTYHYALPVHTKEVYSLTLGLEDDGVTIDPAANVTLSEREAQFAASWQLTSITGPGYIDINSNGYPDNGDRGYWVNYTYGYDVNTTTGDNYYPAQSPEYGMQKMSASASIDQWGKWDTPLRRAATVTTSKVEVYYIEKIETRSHTAVFVTSEREDHISPNKDLHAGRKLDEVRLYRNTDDMQAPYLALQTAVLTHDYSLAKMYMGNDNVRTAGAPYKTATFASNKIKQIINEVKAASGFSNSSLSVVPLLTAQNTGADHTYFDLPDLATLTATAPVNQTGKLTLTSVSILGDHEFAELPSYNFTYSSTNPNYDPHKKDHWGYYKSDYDGDNEFYKYTTETSKTGIEAWSLVAIEEPMGNTVKIEYEADEYEHVNFDGKPKRAYPVSNIQYTPGSRDSWKFIFPKEIDDIDHILPGITFWYNGTTNGPHDCNYYAKVNSDPYTWTRIDITKTAIDLSLNINPKNTPNSCVTPFQYSSDTRGMITLRYPKVPGGGLRVKSVKNYDAANQYMTGTRYTYLEGATKYEPAHFANNGGEMVSSDAAQYSRLYGNAVVGYARVKMETIDKNEYSEGYVMNHYKNYNLVHKTIHRFSQLNCKPAIAQDVEAFRNGMIVEVNDQSSLNGKLLKQETFNQAGQRVASTTYHYEKLKSKWRHELFYQMQEYRLTLSSSIHPCYAHYPPSTPFQGRTKVHTYTHNVWTYAPHMLTKVITEVDGNISVVENKMFDAYTGTPLVTKSYSGGKRKMVRVVPAYTVYPELGPLSLASATALKVNRLEEAAAQYVYSPDEGLTLAEALDDKYMVSASSTVWKKNWNVYLPATGATTTLTSERLWNPVESYAYQSLLGRDKDFVAFDRAAGAVNDDWLSVSTHAKIDLFGHLLETKGSGNNSAMTKYGYDAKVPMVMADHCTYNELYYSGAEEGEIPNNRFESGLKGVADRTSEEVHSGKYAVKIGVQKASFEGVTTSLVPDRKYRMSVWVRKPDNTTLAEFVPRIYYYSVDGAGNTLQNEWVERTDAQTKVSGNWYQLNMDFSIPAAQMGDEVRFAVFNAGTQPMYADDFMLRPMSSTVEAFVYDDRTGRVTHQIDNDNFYTELRYDDMGRVVHVIGEEEGYPGRRIEAENKYNYKRNP